MKYIEYHIDRGEPWKRLIVIKDKRRRRRRVPTEAAASIRVPSGPKAGDYVIPVDINYEGAVELSMSAENTEWLDDGVYEWDLVVTVSASPMFTSTPLVEIVPIGGTLTVRTYENITPMASDGVAVPLEPLL